MKSKLITLTRRNALGSFVKRHKRLSIGFKFTEKTQRKFRSQSRTSFNVY
jgi:hypothetical protein